VGPDAGRDRAGDAGDAAGAEVAARAESDGGADGTDADGGADGTDADGGAKWAGAGNMSRYNALALGLFDQQLQERGALLEKLARGVELAGRIEGAVAGWVLLDDARRVRVVYRCAGCGDVVRARLEDDTPCFADDDDPGGRTARFTERLFDWQCGCGVSVAVRVFCERATGRYVARDSALGKRYDDEPLALLTGVELSGEPVCLANADEEGLQ
jgi:hypothetical protein